MALTEPIPFGLLLKQLRKRAGMTQGDLGAALNYSDSLISSLETSQRLPDLEAVITRFIPALGLQDEAATAAHLIESAAAARGESAPAIPRNGVSRALFSAGEAGEEVYDHLTKLPSSPTELIGRSEEVNQLCNRLLGHGGRLLTLVGPPGIGKTSMAMAVAALLQRHYRDGAVFVALAELTDPAQVASAILAAVGTLDTSSKPAQAKLIENLRRKSMLLVLDNCEQIRDAAPLVAEILATCAGIVILATSRERLHLRAEQRYHLPPLALEAAVELFAQRAAAVDSRFDLTEANRPTVESICERLDCLPLALELCAAQTDLLSLPQLLAQLSDHRLDLLVEGAQDLPPRQRTLRRAIQSSYDLLSDEEGRLFRILGVFVGGFSLEAAAMVGQSTWEGGRRGEPAGLHSTLHALIGKSLVRAGSTPSGEQRFLLLETLREFALEQLQARGEEAEVRQRHYFAYLQLFRTSDSYLRGPEAAIWVARMIPEQDNLRSALQWALDEARYIDMAWLLIAVGTFWYHNGRRYETARWLAQLLPHGQTLTLELRLAATIDFVSAARDLDEFPSLAAYMVEMIELMEICPYKQLCANGWFFWAWLAPDSEHTAVALKRTITLMQEVGEGPTLGTEFSYHADIDFNLAINQAGYGAFLIDEGEIEQATSLMTDSLQRLRQQGGYAYICDCLGYLGLLALMRGDLTEAHTILQEEVTIGTTHNLAVVLAESQPLLALVTLYGGNVSEARRLLEEVLRLCLELKNVGYLAQVCMALAELALWEGNAEEAAHWLGQSFDYQGAPKRINIPELQRLFVAARVATEQEEYGHAAILLGYIEAVHSRIRYVYAGPMLPLVNAAQSKVHAALGDALFEEAFAAGQKLSLPEAFSTLLLPATSEM